MSYVYINELFWPKCSISNTLIGAIHVLIMCYASAM